MIGITGIISAVIGALSAVIPKGFEYADKKMTFAQELAIRKMEAEAREKEQRFALEAKAFEAQAKIEDSYYDAVKASEEAYALTVDERLAQITKPTGYALLDMLNAAIRPVVSLLIMGLFAVAVVSFMFGFAAMNPEFGREMGTMFAMCVEAVVYYVFGRSAVRMPGIVSASK